MLPRLLLIPLILSTAHGTWLDLTRVALDTPEALKTEVTLAGGRVSGSPMVVVAPGPDVETIGRTRMLYFPTADSWIEIPIPFNYRWNLEGHIRIKELPFGTAEGAVFGVYYKTDDQMVLAFAAKLFSPARTFYVISGSAEVADESTMADAVILDEWQKISVGLKFERWSASLGERTLKGELTGTPELSLLTAAERRPEGLRMRVGTFVGWAEIPTYIPGKPLQ